jgi:NAD(P)-dependent dehydrogenase (short-subunit alcohol dehydrogenase family)
VIGMVRNVAKAAAATAPIKAAAAAAGGDLQLVELDLADLRSVRIAADEILRTGTALDLVVANAGVMATPFQRSRDGFELQFATNVLGHFVLVNRLAPRMTDGARLVMLSSSGHRFADIDLADPNFESTPYDPWLAYGRSKTGDALIAVEFDRRNRGRGVRAIAVHPGGILTGLSRHLSPGALMAMIEEINEQLNVAGKPSHEFKSPGQGAATTVWAGIVASANEIGGRYCENCHVSPVLPGGSADVDALEEGVRPYALDCEAAQALWLKAEQLVGERFDLPKHEVH